MLAATIRPAASTKTVLIVDDDPSVNETFGRILELEGYRVFTALAAEEGLAEAERTRPDAIILDLRMPLGDGLQFLRILRSKPIHALTKVALITGDPVLDDLIYAELRSLGAQVRYKPLYFEELTALARQMLSD